MKGGQNKFVEELDECISKSSSNCCNTEVNESDSKKHDIIELIDRTNLKLNKKSKKKTKKKT